MKKRLAFLSVAAAFFLSACQIVIIPNPEQSSASLPPPSSDSQKNEVTTSLFEGETDNPQPTAPEITEPSTPEFIPNTFTEDELESKYLYISGEGQFEVSKNKNIITIILDAADTQYVTMLLNNKPDAFEGLKDFTFYTNTCSVFDSTYQSLTQVYSGLDKLPVYGIAQWNEDAWESEKANEFYSRFHKAGYKMNFFVDADWELRHLIGKADNLALSDEPVSERDFYHRNYGFNNMISTMETADDDYNCFIVQHLWGAHNPIDENTYPSQMAYLFGIVNNYMDKLKEFGVYDDSTIIIMGDHGTHDLYNYPDSTPLFMIKEAGKHSDSMKTSSAPIYFTDLMSTYLISAGLYNEETDKELFGSSIYDFDESSVRERVANYRKIDGNYPPSGISPLCHSYGYNVIYSYSYTGDTGELLKVIKAKNPVITWMKEDAA